MSASRHIPHARRPHGPVLSRRGILAASAALPFASSFMSACAETTQPHRAIQQRLADQTAFEIGCSNGEVTSLRRSGDSYPTDYISPDATLGEVRASIRHGNTGWTTISTRDGVKTCTDQAARTEHTSADLSLASSFTQAPDALLWTISIHNTGTSSVEIGDLYLPMPMNTDFTQPDGAAQAVLKHSFVSGHGSHVFWMRASSNPPWLMMLPVGTTAFQYWDTQPIRGPKDATWCVYLHAAAAEAQARAGGTHWRQPTTALRLAPGEERRYMLRFLWVDSYDTAREAIAKAGLIDVELVPGMTIPRDMSVDLALRSSLPISAIIPEFSQDTTIQALPPRNGRQMYRLHFQRLGENRLTLQQPGGRETYLEFFATEPVETMIDKRAAFIAAHQHRDPSKWYDGLFGEWNMQSHTLLGPDNYDKITGWRIYEVTCDDPGLSKPAFLSLKNAEYPEDNEVAALDRYIEHFVWGGLQRTTDEKFAYGIYGILDWKRNRESPDPGPKGRGHIWRPYDYPHIVNLYFGMYRVARDFPAIPTKLDRAAYLARAYGTANAMFTVPAAMVGWTAFSTGFYNECVIPELIDALRAEGQNSKADILQKFWTQKVATFVQNGASLFGSEYPFDSTGFETTQALARSALDNPQAMGVTHAEALDFSQKQITANLFCRGWLEPSYYYLGSDYRGTAGDAYTLTYMSQMGGWAVLDYALHDAADPYPLLRLGYASQLSAWALLNSGTAQSNYGYWYPGPENDGAAGGGFEPAPSGKTWLGQPHHRGSWYYASEIDLGFCGALRGATTILADDPVFGRICLGGTLSSPPAHPSLMFIPRDGIRRRLDIRLDGLNADLRLLNARFAAEQPISVARATALLSFQVERFAQGAPLRAMLRTKNGPWQAIDLSTHQDRITLDLSGGLSAGARL